MKKFLAIALVVLLKPVVAAAAAPTFATTASGIKITCGATTCDAPTLVTEGLALQGGPSICAISVIVETAGTMTAGGKLLAYIWNPESADSNKWAPVPDFDITVSALAKQGFPSIYVPVQTKGARLTFVSSGIGVANIAYVNSQSCR